MEALKILFVEDLPADAEIAWRELRKEKIEFSGRIVDTEPDFRKELAEFQPDLIISDYAMPGFDGMSALKITRSQAEYIPFIMLTGSLNEETAVACMKAGADDYVLKEKIRRLPFAVRDVLQMKVVKREKEQALQSLRQSEEKYHLLISSLKEGLMQVDNEDRILFVNQALCDMFGYTEEELFGRIGYEILIMKDDQKSILAKNRARLETPYEKYEIRGRKKSGEIIWLSISGSAVHDENGNISGSVGLLTDITERKQAEEALMMSEKSYRELIDGMNETVWIIDFNGNLIDVNRTALETLGYSKAELLSIGIFGIDSSLSKSDISTLIRTMPEDRIQIFESYHRCKDGRSIPVEIYSSLVNYRGEQVILSIARDITERKQAEHDLIASETRYRRLFEAARDGILILDAETGIIQDVNPFLVEIMGKPREEFCGKMLWELGFFNDIVANKANLLELQKKKHIRYENLPLKTASGQKLDVEFVSNVYLVDSKKVIQCNIRDITERIRAENELHESNERFDQLAQQSRTFNWEVDEEGLYTYISHIVEQVAGYSPDEIVGKLYFYDLHPEAGREEFKESAFEFFKCKKRFLNLENPIQTKDGGMVWVSTNGFPLINADGSLRGYRGSDSDITDRKQMQLKQEILFKISEALNRTYNLTDLCHEIRTLLGQVMDTTNFFVALYDPKTDTISLLYDVDEKDNYKTFPAGKTLAKYVIDTAKPLLVTWEEIEKMSREGIVQTIGTPAKIWLGVPLIGEKNVIGMIALQSYDDPDLYSQEDIGILSFISEEIALAIKRTKAEEQIKRNLEEKELLLRELYHRTKNNMQVIMSMLRLQTLTSPEGKDPDANREIINKIHSMSLVHQKLYEAQDLSRINFQEYIEDFIHPLLQSFGPRAEELSLQLDLQPLMLNIDMAIPLGLVFTELISNIAKHAFPDNSTGTITIRLCQGDPEGLCLELADNGVGIPAGTNLREGNSMGLKNVFSLIEYQLKGKIEYQVNGGLRWRIVIDHLPRKVRI